MIRFGRPTYLRAMAANPGLRRKPESSNLKLRRFLPALPSFFYGLITGLLLLQVQLKQLAAPARQPDIEQRRHKVLCAAMTGTSDYESRRDVKIAASWGRHCDRLLFLGWMENVTRVPHATIVKQEEDTHEFVGRKEFRTWKYLSDHFGEEYDFFFKTDTDTFAIMDNYRRFVSKLDPDLPHYFGKQFTFLDSRMNRQFVVGSSVSLSRSALRWFGRAANGKFLDKDGKRFEKCAEPYWLAQGHAGDVALSDCLWELGIYSMNTRDEENRERFMNISPGLLMKDGKFRDWWYADMSFNIETGNGCCAEDAIAWHGVNPDKFNQTPEYREGIWHFPEGY